MNLPSQVSDSTRKRNPHLYPESLSGPVGGEKPSTANAGLAKRVKQDKPLNKLEREFGEWLKRHISVGAIILEQSMRLRLGSGCWWKCDFVSWQLLYSEPDYDNAGQLCFWEVKGPKSARWSRRGELTIKVAASKYRMFRFFLAWKEDGQFQIQEIEP